MELQRKKNLRTESEFRTVHLGVTVPSELKEKLSDAADQRNESVSKFVNDAINAYFAQIDIPGMKI